MNIIDKLASKELSFGCMVSFGEKHEYVGRFITWVTKYPEGKEEVRVQTQLGNLQKLKLEWVKPIGHPILIGDVLKKVLPLDDGNGQIIELVSLWLKVTDKEDNSMINKSLQEIAEDVEVICGKCKKVQELEIKQINSKVITYWCPNCQDQISPSTCAKPKTN